MSSCIIMSRAPIRDKKRPYGVVGMVAIEHQRHQAQRGWGTDSTGRMVRTVFGSVCVCVCVYTLSACLSVHQPGDFDVLVPNTSRWKTTIKDR